jgi:hypothetical protein
MMAGASCRCCEYILEADTKREASVQIGGFILLIEAVEDVKGTLEVMKFDSLDPADADKMDGVAEMVVPATPKSPKLQKVMVHPVT